MKVLWRGDPTELKKVDDPVVQPRLKATLDAHRLLWSIRLLVRPSLTTRQRQLAQDLCEIELLTQSRERTEKLKTLYGQVVQDALAREDRKIPTSARDYEERVDQIVGELMAVGHKGEGFAKRLQRLIGRAFPDSGR